jgi:hypothetical protein
VRNSYCEVDLSMITCSHRVDRKKQKRFASAFSSPSVRMLRLNGVIFVMLNSMAFEGDNCEMCSEARRQFTKITKSLNCAKVSMTWLLPFPRFGTTGAYPSN